MTASWLVVANKSPVLFFFDGGREVKRFESDGTEGPKEWERVGNPA